MRYFPKKYRFLTFFTLLVLATSGSLSYADGLGADPDWTAQEDLRQEEQRLLESLGATANGAELGVIEEQDLSDSGLDISETAESGASVEPARIIGYEREVDLGIEPRIRLEYVAPKLPVGTVKVAQVPVRMGPGLTYNWVFVAKEGSELRVERIRGDWVRALTPTGVRGWFPTSSVSFSRF